MTNLTTQRLTMKRPQEQDRASYVAYYTSKRRASSGPVQTQDQAEVGFENLLSHWDDKGFGRFVVFLEGTAIGLIGPHQPKSYPEPEMAWQIWQDAHEGKGYAAEASRAALDYAFGPLGWKTAVSYIANDNQRSIALATRLGAVVDPNAAIIPNEVPHQVFRHPKAEVTQ